MGKRSMGLAALLAGGLILLFTNLPAHGQSPEEDATQQSGAALGTGFTYQGRVYDGDGPVEGACDFRFALYDAATGGNQVGATLTEAGVAVESGLFTVLLDFGPVFDGTALYLQVEVACPAGSGGYETIAPRQALTPTPQALYSASAPWSGLLGVPAGFADGSDDGLTSVGWTDVQNRPAGLDDGDDDTTYSAGSGLVLGDTTFSLAQGYRLPQSCAAGEIAEWDGAKWVCATDDAGAGAHDHDDRYYTKTQLQTSGSASVHWKNLSNVPAGFADGSDNNTTYSAGTGLDLSGTRFSVASLPMGGFVDRTLDSASNVGTHSSIIIGTDGLPLISYYDAANGNLKVYHCDDMICSGGTATTLDSAGVVGKYTSITIGRDGYGMISYYDEGNGDLKLAHCQNLACTSANTTTVDSGGDVGRYTSITTNESGYAFIAYYDVTNSDLKAVSCGDLTCSSKTTWPVDSAGDVGQYAAVVRDGRDYGWISYYDATNGNLKVARCVSMNCGTPILNDVDGMDVVNGAEEDAGRYTSITVGSDGQPLIAYAKVNQPGASSAALRVAHCDDNRCLTASVDTVIVGNDLDFTGISITTGRDGFGLISSTFATTSRVYVTHCSNAVCDRQTINDNAVASGAVDTSITIGADGLPILSYGYDIGGGALRFVHCSDWSCQPYLRRR